MALKQTYLLDMDDIVRENFFVPANADATIRGLSKNGSAVLSTKIGGLNNNSFTDQQTLVWVAARQRFESAALGASGEAGGHLKGNYPNPEIGDKVIQPELHFKSSPYGAKKIARTNAAGSAWEVVTKTILNMDEPIVGDARKIVRVNAAGDGYEMVDSGVVGARSLQHKIQKYPYGDNTTTPIPIGSSPPLKTQGKTFATVNITPLSDTSLIHIKFHAFLCADDPFRGILALFQGASNSAVYATFTEIGDGNSEPAALLLEAWLPSPGKNVNTPYYINFGSNASGKSYINQTHDNAGVFGAAKASFLEIEEVATTMTVMTPP